MKLIDEVKSKPVITTRQVMLESSLITIICYDEDGDWQFFGEEAFCEADAMMFCEADAMIVSVQQIIGTDNSLMTLPDMLPGDRVQRSLRTDSWRKY